jgi:hypothetical protein
VLTEIYQLVREHAEMVSSTEQLPAFKRPNYRELFNGEDTMFYNGACCKKDGKFSVFMQVEGDFITASFSGAFSNGIEYDWSGHVYAREPERTAFIMLDRFEDRYGITEESLTKMLAKIRQYPANVSPWAEKMHCIIREKDVVINIYDANPSFWEGHTQATLHWKELENLANADARPDFETIFHYRPRKASPTIGDEVENELPKKPKT